jgi:hypothetical protein
MNLASDRFYQNTTTKRFTLTGRHWNTPYTRYSYESHTTLYDVDVRKSDNLITYHVNMGFDTEPNKYHNAIVKHFNLEVDMTELDFERLICQN